MGVAASSRRRVAGAGRGRRRRLKWRTGQPARDKRRRAKAAALADIIDSTPLRPGLALAAGLRPSPPSPQSLFQRAVDKLHRSPNARCAAPRTALASCTRSAACPSTHLRGLRCGRTYTSHRLGHVRMAASGWPCHVDRESNARLTASLGLKRGLSPIAVPARRASSLGSRALASLRLTMLVVAADKPGDV